MIEAAGSAIKPSRHSHVQTIACSDINSHLFVLSTSTAHHFLASSIKQLRALPLLECLSDDLLLLDSSTTLAVLLLRISLTMPPVTTTT